MNLSKSNYNELQMIIIYALLNGYAVNDDTKKVCTKFEVSETLEEVFSKLELLV